MHVVLIDDDDIDVQAVARLLHAGSTPHQLTFFPNGQLAQHALSGPFGKSLQAEPHLLLLDLQMPVMDGWTFLDWFAAQRWLRLSVIFVFTATDDADSIARAYRQPISGYLIKGQLGPGYLPLRPLIDAYATTNTFVPARRHR